MSGVVVETLASGLCFDEVLIAVCWSPKDIRVSKLIQRVFGESPISLFYLVTVQ